MVTKGGTASASKEETKSSAESNDLERDGRSLPCRQRPKLGAPAASNALVLGLDLGPGGRPEEVGVGIQGSGGDQRLDREGFPMVPSSRRIVT